MHATPRPRPLGPTRLASGVALATGVALLLACTTAEPAPPPPPEAAPVVERPTPAPSPVTPEPEPEPEPEPGLDLTQHSTTDPASPWVVVNKRNPVDPPTFAPDDLVDVAGVRLREIVVPDLEQMLAAAADDGVRLLPRSGYRSYDEQRAARAAIEARRGFAHAERYSARPGHSEHQTGLALDIDSASTPSCNLQTCFATTPEGRWLADNATDHGFLVRYTPENSDVVGFAAEPWHLRWVGHELTAWMVDEGHTTLEEVFDVPGGPDYPD
ncbi:M15 family metallopeptidase [Cellulomonas bogoriensis]|uniref:Peptidase M15 n=1 Tax=Cellulomonas bogoriensis 69B4 = DSM 16987 TaxID=1386082 RepID=A0A0A0BXW0_9CELL|nr:M15 family metallopeptidase [Cellulomonas bogoriensis]KGM12029.1 peptidase M15 [Cellulomonas bogoriensis 69B4 = DSM 16987]